MLVDQLRLERWGDGRELSGRVCFERGSLEPERLWFRSPEDPSGPLVASPFLPALLLLSMELGEPLVIAGPVSAALLDQAERASLVLRSWWPGLAPAKVEAGEGVPAIGGGALGVFFSRGVDSWYSILETVAESEERVRLLGWPGGDYAVVHAGSPAAATALEADSTAALREAAQLVDGRLDVIESNLRALVEPHVRWSYSHGSLLAALALAHGGLAEARLAGTLPLGKVVPLGSHPLLDPLWSTESTRIVHHAAETPRVSKVAALARRPDVLAALRVCDRMGELGNCGICDKCVRTMLALELAGALSQAPFDAPLSRRRIRRLGVAKPIERAFGEELLNAFARAQRLDLAHPLQLAFVTDLSNRALRRLAALPADWLHRLRSRAG